VAPDGATAAFFGNHGYIILVDGKTKQVPLLFPCSVLLTAFDIVLWHRHFAIVSGCPI
jgi:hypothetical protein